MPLDSPLIVDTNAYSRGRPSTAFQILSVAVSFVTEAVVVYCIAALLFKMGKWKDVPAVLWLVSAVYVQSLMFTLATAILRYGVGTEGDPIFCHAAVNICLTFYITGKVAIFFFWIEKAYIVRGRKKERHRDVLYLVNTICVFGPYSAISVLNLIYRYHYINAHGMCVIGMKTTALVLLIVYEVLTNIYLTFLFLDPLRKLYSFKVIKKPALRRMAFRTFVGSCAMIAVGVINLTVIAILQGEKEWICLTSCNAGNLFCVMVLHWVLLVDKKEHPSRNTARAGSCTAEEKPPTIGTAANTNRRTSVTFADSPWATSQHPRHSISTTITGCSLSPLEESLSLPYTISVTTELSQEASYGSRNRSMSLPVALQMGDEEESLTVMSSRSA